MQCNETGMLLCCCRQLPNENHETLSSEASHVVVARESENLRLYGLADPTHYRMHLGV
jgi:hypothetical protein